MLVLSTFLLSFLVTVCIECGLAACLGVRTRRGQELVFLVNLMTNPAAVYLHLLSTLLVGKAGQQIVTIVLEILVILLESEVYAHSLDRADVRMTGVYAYVLNHTQKKTAAMFLSLLLNAGSFFLGSWISGIGMIAGWWT